ncbi:MAG: class I SAM-dependent rRNA methyltransferase [Thermoguttaceae bacterium]|nr:class I SAM-dependent rRNA methyltransferase [Thermoguttaceae bacterium]
MEPNAVPLARVVLKPNRVRALATHHPWVRDTSIASIEGFPVDGGVVDLVNPKGHFIGRGIFNGHSKLRVRLYTWDESVPLDRDFWSQRLDRALRLRTSLGYRPFRPSEATVEISGVAGVPCPAAAGAFVMTEAMRLVNSEGDSLSGLVVDQYGDYLVVQVTSLAMALRLDTLVPLLVEKTGAKGVFVRTEKNIAKVEDIQLEERVPYWGEMPPVISGIEQGVETSEPADSSMSGDHAQSDFHTPVLVRDAGICYEVYPAAAGQKTGLYLDQRENRLAAARYLTGCNVLDMFCYNGGFSLAALQHGATHCTAYDTSVKAVEQTLRNAKLNGFGPECLTAERGEAYDVLEALAADPSRRFGGVILDPPKFARSKGAIEEALRGYHYLNRLGLALVKPEGFLVTCSCSGSVLREDFFDMLIGAAQQAGREVQVLEQRGAAADHPVAINCPESEYLKCFICRVL